jgi:hypothetical protein
VRRVVVEVAAVTPLVTTSWPLTIHWARIATLQNKKAEVWCARVYGLHPPLKKKKPGKTATRVVERGKIMRKGKKKKGGPRKKRKKEER